MSCLAADLVVSSGGLYALDNICNTPDLVASGDGQLLYIRWLYPHLAVNSCGSPGNKPINRAAGRHLKRAPLK
jgi:hypothetical protein